MFVLRYKKLKVTLCGCIQENLLAKAYLEPKLYLILVIPFSGIESCGCFRREVMKVEGFAQSVILTRIK